MKINYKRPFVQFVKKASKPLQLAIEDRVIKIFKNPNSGEQKTGDLREIWVYKFRFNKQEYLMAYRLGKCDEGIDLIWISFYQIGSHENFYSELKRFLRHEPELDKVKGGEK